MTVLQVSVDSIINGHAKLTAKGRIPRGGQVTRAPRGRGSRAAGHPALYLALHLDDAAAGHPRRQVDLEPRDDGFLGGSRAAHRSAACAPSTTRNGVTSSPERELEGFRLCLPLKAAEPEGQAVTATDLFARMVIRPDQTR